MFTFVRAHKRTRCAVQHRLWFFVYVNAWRYTHGEDERQCLYPKAVSAEWKLGTRVRLKVRQVERTCRCVFREEGNDNALTRLAPMSSASSSDHGWALTCVCAPPVVPPGGRACRRRWTPLRHRAHRTMAYAVARWFRIQLATPT